MKNTWHHNVMVGYKLYEIGMFRSYESSSDFTSVAFCTIFFPNKIKIIDGL